MNPSSRFDIALCVQTCASWLYGRSQYALEPIQTAGHPSRDDHERSASSGTAVSSAPPLPAPAASGVLRASSGCVTSAWDAGAVVPASSPVLPLVAQAPRRQNETTAVEAAVPSGLKP